jgi:hypothetical protein
MEITITFRFTDIEEFHHFLLRGRDRYCPSKPVVEALEKLNSSLPPTLVLIKPDSPDKAPVIWNRTDWESDKEKQDRAKAGMAKRNKEALVQGGLALAMAKWMKEHQGIDIASSPMFLMMVNAMTKNPEMIRKNLPGFPLDKYLGEIEKNI